MTLKKKDIVEKVRSRLNCTKAKAKRVIEDLLEIMKQEAEMGNEIMISNFGKFYVQEKEGRLIRNPATNGLMKLPPIRRVNFKTSEKLKERMNG